MTDRPDDPSEKPGEVIGLDRRQLIIRHLGGDEAAFPELVNIYRAPIYTYLVRAGIREKDRDDLFQEVFVKIHLGASSYKIDQPLNPWIFTIVANTVRSFYRKERVRSVFSLTHEAKSEARSVDAQQTAEAKETASILNEALQKLPFHQREVVLLSSSGNLSHEDVGSILGVPVGTVKTNLRRARFALAKALCRQKLRIEREVEK